MANYVANAAGSADAQLVTGRGRLLGLSARESAGAAATFVLRDGTSTSGSMLAAFSLGANGTINGDWGAIEGIEFQTGLYLDMTSGSAEITVYR